MIGEMKFSTVAGKSCAAGRFFGMLALASLLAAGAGEVRAQTQDALEAESMNPLGKLVMLPIENNTLFGVGPAKATANVLNIKPVFPLNFGDWNLINRVTLPLVWTEGQGELAPGTLPSQTGVGGEQVVNLACCKDSGSGVGDINYQAFASPAKAGAVAWGVGGGLVMPTASQRRFGADKWSAGPAFVLTASPGKWVLAGIVQNIWSFAGSDEVPDVNVFSAQLSVNYLLGGGWYLTTAPLITADWNAESANRWTVPLGGGVGRVFRLEGKKAVAVDFGAYYNVERPNFVNRWYSQLLVSFLFPK